MPDPILGPTEVWDTDALIEIKDALFPSTQLPPVRCRTGAVPGTKGTSKKVLSFYLRPEHTADGMGQFYISPLVGESEAAIRLLGKLVCEALHPDNPKTQAWFGRMYLGIEWSTRTPVPIDTLDGDLGHLAPTIIANLGPRPHGAAVPVEQIRTPKTTALLRASCPHCDVPVRVTLTALQAAWPVCVGNGSHSPVYFTARAATGETLFASDAFPCNRDANNLPCP